MQFVFNPFTGTLDIVSSGTGGGAVNGPTSSTDKAIARWNGTSGTLLQNSLTIVQDGGAVQGQGFVFNRVIQNDVTIPDKYVMITRDIVMDTGDIIMNGDAELIVL